MMCPYCGTDVADAARYCSVCGSVLPLQASRSNAGKPSGHKTPRGKKGAPKTGAAKPQSPYGALSAERRAAGKTCPYCGDEIGNGVRFCPRCGKSVSGKAPESNAGRSVIKPSGTNPVQDKSGSGQQSQSGQLFSIDAMLKQMKRDAVNSIAADFAGKRLSTERLFWMRQRTT